MSITLFILAIIVAIIGLIGVIFPVIPAAIVSYVGLLLYYFSGKSEDTITSLVIWGIFMIVATLVDNFLSPLITKKFGGSKKAAWGSFIGIFIGAFIVPPFGMLIGAFVGALLGEMVETNKLGEKELLVALGSFLGFITGTGIKLVYALLVLWHIIF